MFKTNFFLQTHFGNLLLSIFLLVYPLFITYSYASSEKVWLLPRLMLLVVVGMLGLFYNKGLKSYRNTFCYLIALWLLLVIASGFNTNDNLAFTLLGPNNRLDGLIYQVALVLFAFFVYRTIKESPRGLPVLLYSILTASVIQAIFAIFQRFHLDFIGPLTRNMVLPLPTGTIGHPGMLAGFIMPSLIFGLGLYLNEKRRYAKLFLLIALAIIACGLGATTNRSAVFALAFAFLLFNIFEHKLKLFLLSCGIIGLVWASHTILPVLTNVANQGQSQYSEANARNYTDTGTLKTRLKIWQLAWQSLSHIPNQPFIGGGPDAFRLALLRDIPPEKYFQLLRLEEGWPANAEIGKFHSITQPDEPIRNTTYHIFFDTYGKETNQSTLAQVTLDKAHNFILDRWLSYGAIAVIIWLILYLYPVSRGAFSKSTLRASLSWSILAIFIYYLAWFPNVQVEPIHITLLALAWGLQKVKN